MGWSRFDDRYAQHPKMVSLGDFYEVGIALDVAGIGWCSLHETDGRVPKAQVPRLIQCRAMQIGRTRVTPELVAEKLVTAGRWEDHGDHYVIHDYLDYNPSRAQNSERRAQVATRVKRHRNGARNGVTSTLVTPDETRTKRDGNHAPEPEPVTLPTGASRARAREGDGTAPGAAWGHSPIRAPVPPELDPAVLQQPEIAEAFRAAGCLDPPLGARHWHAKRLATRADQRGWRTDWQADLVAWLCDHARLGCPCQPRVVPIRQRAPVERPLPNRDHWTREDFIRHARDPAYTPPTPEGAAS